MNRKDILNRLSKEYGGRGLPVHSHGKVMGVQAREQWDDGLAVYVALEADQQLSAFDDGDVSAAQLYELAQALASAQEDLERVLNAVYQLAAVADDDAPAEFHYVLRRNGGAPFVATAAQLKHRLDLSEIAAGPFTWDWDARREIEILKKTLKEGTHKVTPYSFPPPLKA